MATNDLDEIVTYYRYDRTSFYYGLFCGISGTSLFIIVVLALTAFIMERTL